MALNENLRLPDLLAPIPGDSPVGPDLKYSNEFSEIEWAHNQGQDAVPPVTPPGFPGAEAEEHFGRVIELGEGFLLNQSKDLRVASFMTSAFLRVGRGEDEDPVGAACFKGLSFGLQLLRGLMGEYWEDLHSSIPARVAVLGVLGSEGLAIPVRLVPLTDWGHSHFHFKDWSSDAVPETAPSDENTLWAGNFEAGLADTDKESYDRLASALEECLESLDGLETFCKEKFGETGEPPPRFRDLKTALEQTSSAVTQLLERKEPPPPEPERAPEPTTPEGEPEASVPDAAAPEAAAPEAAAPEVSASDAPMDASSEGGAPAGSQAAETPASTPAPDPRPPPSAAPPSADPQGADQAIEAVVSAARVLREEDPRNPVPYLLIRGLRWGEVRAG
ncbi:MAG: type VI secretion system ImpA family N-terminal domain-containing protein, partial [Gemmatimonadetes bacterium]|nr:type VI secretion system ImpA family N-terminal domain-containing protein [Gemmatimonadota bacterium]